MHFPRCTPSGEVLVNLGEAAQAKEGIANSAVRRLVRMELSTTNLCAGRWGEPVDTPMS
jgi:hypothetical protein